MVCLNNSDGFQGAAKALARQATIRTLWDSKIHPSYTSPLLIDRMRWVLLTMQNTWA